jgi:hypothetical protein
MILTNRDVAQDDIVRLIGLQGDSRSESLSPPYIIRYYLAIGDSTWEYDCQKCLRMGLNRYYYLL